MTRFLALAGALPLFAASCSDPGVTAEVATGGNASIAAGAPGTRTGAGAEAAGGSGAGAASGSGGAGAANAGGADPSATGGALPDMDPPPSDDEAIFLSPTGSDSNPGSFAEPLYSLAVAVVGAGPNTLIYLLDGTYDYGATVSLSASGTAENPIRVWAYGDAEPVLDFSSQPYGSENRGLMLTGDHWYLKGIAVTYAGDNGLKIEGSYNIVERCVFHHNGDSGVQLGFGHDTVNPNGELCAYNQIINCDSYLNFDFDSRGGDADGFACKMHNGKGNAFRGCRSWRNSDDGWDLYETDWPVEITDCWTWHNGDQADFDAIYVEEMGQAMSSFSGNGNGFKLGGNGSGGNSVGTHVVTRCVAFDNNYRSKKGFDQNSHQGGELVRNCVAWGNGYNYMFETNATDGNSDEFFNNISFDGSSSAGYEFASNILLTNNSWQLAVTADAADFVDLSEEAALAPRQADGSLPDNGFARLLPGSDLIDQGVDLGMPYQGAAPDLGAFELE